jgi:hypothetical protein
MHSHIIRQTNGSVTLEPSLDTHAADVMPPNPHLARAAELHEWRLELAATHAVLVKQLAPVWQALHEVPVGCLWRQHLRDGLRLERCVGAHVHAQLAAGAVHRGHLRSNSIAPMVQNGEDAQLSTIKATSEARMLLRAAHLHAALVDSLQLACTHTSKHTQA